MAMMEMQGVLRMVLSGRQRARGEQLLWERNMHLDHSLVKKKWGCFLRRQRRGRAKLQHHRSQWPVVKLMVKRQANEVLH
jgi:hypothetical protein